MSTLHWTRRPFRGQGRIADTFGKVAEWVTAGRGISHPYPGVELETRLQDRIQRQMWAGTYEAHVRTCMETLIEEGQTILDVGAHIGFHAITAAFLCGSRGHVAAFEPDPELHRQLRKNLAQFPWAYAIYGAVRERSGDICFERSVNRRESGTGTVANVRDQGREEIVRVPSIAIDDWAQKSGIYRVDFLKADAGGSEAAMVRGAVGTIGQYLPILLLDLNDELLPGNGSGANGLVEMLTQLGYRSFRISWLRLEEWNPARSRGVCDILCLPEGREGQAISKLEKAGFSLAS